MGENVTFDLSVSALKAGICKKIVENGKNDQFVNEIETKSSFLWQPNAKTGGLWVTAETISKNMGSLGDSSAENRGLWSLTSASPP